MIELYNVAEALLRRKLACSTTRALFGDVVMAKTKPTSAPSFGDLDILRYILKTLYGGDRDELAVRLIERFGGVVEVFDAAQSELMRVKGVTERAASFFAFVKPMYRQALLRSEPDLRIDSEAALVRYAAVYFMNDRVPLDACLYLDKNDKIIRADRLAGDNITERILSGVCRHGAVKTALLRYVPHENDLSAVRTLDGVEAVARIAEPLALVDAAITDCIEYYPFGFYALRRALAGDCRALPVQSASESKYERMADFCEKSAAFVSALRKSIAQRHAQ